MQVRATVPRMQLDDVFTGGRLCRLAGLLGWLACLDALPWGGGCPDRVLGRQVVRQLTAYVRAPPTPPPALPRPAAKEEIARNVKEELQKSMTAFGFQARGGGLEAASASLPAVRCTCAGLLGTDDLAAHQPVLPSPNA